MHTRHTSVYHRLVEAPWWGAALQSQGLAWWLEAVDATALAAQPLRRRVGLLHATADLLKHLGHRMQVTTVSESNLHSSGWRADILLSRTITLPLRWQTC